MLGKAFLPVASLRRKTSLERIIGEGEMCLLDNNHRSRPSRPAQVDGTAYVE
jgi:hypothetical protein